MTKIFHFENIFTSPANPEVAKEKRVAYFIEDGLRMQKWCLGNVTDSDWSAVYQIVVPNVCHLQVLCLVHDHHFTVHLEVTKTYNQILRHFFWPSLKKYVVEYCHTCI